MTDNLLKKSFMSHRKTLIASGISALSVILKKTFTRLNNRGKCLFILVKGRQNNVLKFLQSA